MELKARYKQTEVGVIPEDWNCSALGNLCDTSSGTTPSRSLVERYFRGGTINWVKTLDLNNSVIFSTDERVTEAALNETSLRVYPKNTVLVAMYGGFNQIGRTGILSFPACVNQAITAVRCGTQLDAGYLLATLNFKVEYWKSVASSSRKDPNITSKDIRDFVISYPPKAEQQAIAEALSDADALIESLDQLIAKKRQIKQGAMQELLTGKRRLPGFSGKWKEVAIKKVVQTPVTDGPHMTPVFLDDGVPFLSVNNLIDGKIDFSDLRYISVLDHEEFSKKCKPQKEDILLGKAASVGKVALVETDTEFNIWSPLALIRVNSKNHAKFVYYQLQSTNLNRQISLLTNSSSQGNIGMGDIEKLVLPLPDKDEQLAIATVLSDMDTELAALEVQLAKAQQIKQGMMQELLTGRIRLL